MFEIENFNIYEVLKFLPHRYPFLMVDRVISYEAGKSLQAIKNVTVNEPYFPGHFPHRPVMPGVLILETMAQATGILAIVTAQRKLTDSSLYYFVGVDKARFKKPVEPGDQLVVDVTLTRHMKNLWKFNCTAKVDDAVVTQAELMCAESDFQP